MLSVPYALFSNTSNNGVPSGGGQGQVLTNCEGIAIWTIGGICPGVITAINCSTATNNGTLTKGIAAASVSSSVPYTGGNGGPHNGQTVTSTGVTGLTATLVAGNFATGAGSLTYTITGTPATSGTASFALNIGGKTCTLTRTVALPVGTITALSCSTATNAGTLGQGVAAASVSSTVPYTGGNGGTHTGQTVTSTGVTGLTATRAAGNFATGSGTLVYTITGTPATSGTASFALNMGGQTCTLTRTVLASASITALNCSTATNNGTLGQGTAAASVSSSVPYTGGNGGYRGAQTFTSTGVTGLTATCAAGTLASGAGNLTFTITGTPASAGTASFALNIGGQTCTLNRTVLPIASITALSCSTATNNGTLTQGIAAASVNSSIPYTGGNGGYRSAQTVTSTGVTGLTATCAAGTLASGVGSLTFTISGTPASAGTASFALSIGGQTCTLTRAVNPPAVTDIDGNVYQTVTIGTQLWMKENLKVSKYRNGDPIPTSLDNTEWSTVTAGACAIYNNDAANNTTYGKLYNWYAVADSRNLCPVGWHVPSDAEWKTLEISLGMSASDADLIDIRGVAQNVGGKLKSTSSLWNAPNTAATNESGFSGLPGGLRLSNGPYGAIGGWVYWWSSTSYSAADAWARDLNFGGGSSFRHYDSKLFGFSVRCLRD